MSDAEKSEQKQLSPKEQRLLEVQREYTNECMKLGDIDYKIDALKVESTKIKRALRAMNKEAARIQQQLQQEAPSAKS